MVVKMKHIIIPETEAVLTPQEFVRLKETQRKSIESVTITPPTLGRRGFGRLVVKWKYPILRRERVARKLDKVG